MTIQLITNDKLDQLIQDAELGNPDSVCFGSELQVQTFTSFGSPIPKWWCKMWLATPLHRVYVKTWVVGSIYQGLLLNTEHDRDTLNSTLKLTHPTCGIAKKVISVSNRSPKQNIQNSYYYFKKKNRPSASVPPCTKTPSKWDLLFHTLDMESPYLLTLDTEVCTQKCQMKKSFWKDTLSWTSKWI